MSTIPAPLISWESFQTLARDEYAALAQVSGSLGKNLLEPQLLELVAIRISQLNGCAFCLHWHLAAARAAKIADDRLHLLATWRLAPGFSDRERTALAWAEALTRTPGDLPEAIGVELASRFTVPEIAHLTAAVAMTNLWNRVAGPLRWTLPASA